MKKPWTKEMLDKLGVKLGALMGTEPWALPGNFVTLFFFVLLTCCFLLQFAFAYDSGKVSNWKFFFLLSARVEYVHTNKKHTKQLEGGSTASTLCTRVFFCCLTLFGVVLLL